MYKYDINIFHYINIFFKNTAEIPIMTQNQKFRFLFSRVGIFYDLNFEIWANEKNCRPRVDVLLRLTMLGF